MIDIDIELYQFDNINYREFSIKLYRRLLDSNISFDLKRKELAKIHRWVRIKQIEEFNSTPRMKEIITNIHQNDFIVDAQFIRYSNSIYITTIFDNNNLITLSKDIQYNLIKHGYGIFSFWLEKMHIIKEVWCDGKHPNLNCTDHTFCIDRQFKESPLTLENVLFLRDMFSSVNMKSMYSDDIFISIVRSKQ